MSRGSTLIYHFGFAAIRSRTHFPATILPGLTANDPGSLLNQTTVLFPFNAIFNSESFYHRFLDLVKGCVGNFQTVLCDFIKKF